MRKHIYGDVTYGMRYKQYSKILSQKMQLARKCKGYEEFKEDPFPGTGNSDACRLSCCL